MSTRTARNFFIAGAVLGAANFVAFAIGSAYLGGDAAAGKQEGDRYYLGNHGKYTEVSPETYAYSRWHARSIWITHPVAMLCMLLAYGANEKLKQPPEPGRNV